MTEVSGDGACFSRAEAAEWTAGRWQGADASTLIQGIFSDTRTARPGAMYVAIKGEKFDGHAFVRQALAAGASAVMVNASADIPLDIPALCVADTAKALTDLAAGWRAKVDPVIVGVTGSAGKTTVKELTSHLLGALGKTARTCGNWNNNLGLPKSILAMPADTKMGIFEVGTNHPGEIAPLAALMKPDCAVLTNIGPVHIEFFGTERAIANEKADLLRAVPAEGFVVLDADSAQFGYLSSQVSCRVVTVSLNSDADFRAMGYDADAGFFTVREKSSGEEHEIFTGQPGVHQVVNALEATAVARQFGVSWAAISERFATVPRMPMRWERIEEGGVVWINDAYNANPLSMQKSVETFASMDSQSGRKIAVLGDMFELGVQEEVLHGVVGEVVGKSGVDILVAVGARSSRWLADAAVAAGMEPAHVFRTADVPEARRLLAPLLTKGVHVLLKASRGMALENILKKD